MMDRALFRFLLLLLLAIVAFTIIARKLHAQTNLGPIRTPNVTVGSATAPSIFLNSNADGSGTITFNTTPGGSFSGIEGNQQGMIWISTPSAGSINFGVNLNSTSELKLLQMNANGITLPSLGPCGNLATDSTSKVICGAPVPTIPSVTNLLAGDGSGGIVDSTIVPSNVAMLTNSPYPAQGFNRFPVSGIATSTAILSLTGQSVNDLNYAYLPCGLLTQAVPGTANQPPQMTATVNYSFLNHCGYNPYTGNSNAIVQGQYNSGRAQLVFDPTQTALYVRTQQYTGGTGAPWNAWDTVCMHDANNCTGGGGGGGSLPYTSNLIAGNGSGGAVDSRVALTNSGSIQTLLLSGAQYGTLSFGSAATPPTILGSAGALWENASSVTLRTLTNTNYATFSTAGMTLPNILTVGLNPASYGVLSFNNTLGSNFRGWAAGTDANGSISMYFHVPDTEGIYFGIGGNSYTLGVDATDLTMQGTVNATALSAGATGNFKVADIGGGYTALTLNSTLSNSGRIGLSGSAQDNTLYLSTDTGGVISFIDPSHTNMIVTSNGTSIGNGTTMPTHTLDIGANAWVTASGAAYFASGLTTGTLVIPPMYNCTQPVFDSGGTIVCGGYGRNAPGTMSATPLTSTGKPSHVVPTTPKKSKQVCRRNAMWHDDDYIYVCVASGNIKRAALVSFQ